MKPKELLERTLDLTQIPKNELATLMAFLQRKPNITAALVASIAEKESYPSNEAELIHKFKYSEDEIEEIKKLIKPMRVSLEEIAAEMVLILDPMNQEEIKIMKQAPRAILALAYREAKTKINAQEQETKRKKKQIELDKLSAALNLILIQVLKKINGKNKQERAELFKDYRRICSEAFSYNKGSEFTGAFRFGGFKFCDNVKEGDIVSKHSHITVIYRPQYTTIIFFLNKSYFS